MNIAFFVSAHGFGHAARAAAIMSALRRREPNIDLEVFTRVPEWFFSETLSGPIRYHAVTTDVGMVQKDPFVVDIPATLDRLGDFLPFSDSKVQEMAAELTARECRAVVCDISPFGIAVAKAAGVPSILVENFTWEWLYSFYRKAYPAFNPFVEKLAPWFSAADVHVQTEPVCNPLPGAHRLFPISRPPKNGAKAVRKSLGVSDTCPLVLITMGGVAMRYQFARLLEKIRRAIFVLPNDVPRASRHDNIISLTHHSAFYHPDLVQAADLVIGKLGYSTLAEVGHAGKPFGYITRAESPESPVLAYYAKQHIQGRAISEEEIASNRWIEFLDTLLETGGGPPAFPNDGDKMADIVLDTASSMTVTGSVPTFQNFDPFNDRTSRDIRNRLSEAFVTALEHLEIEPVRQEADTLKNLFPSAAYRNYIQERVCRYSEVLNRAATDRISDPRHLALLIWNAGLFFECHEHLEGVWLHAEGDERKALQGFIKAAGVFVHRELGRKIAAEKLSVKAVTLLQSHRKQLSFITNMDSLMSALKNEGAGAPELKGP